MNQIARTLNSANLTGSPLNSLRILTSLRQIEELLKLDDSVVNKTNGTHLITLSGKLGKGLHLVTSASN